MIHACCSGQFLTPSRSRHVPIQPLDDRVIVVDFRISEEESWSVQTPSSSGG